MLPMLFFDEIQDAKLEVPDEAAVKPRRKTPSMCIAFGFQNVIPERHV